MTQSTTFWSAISQSISAATATPFTVRGTNTLGGGCINTTYMVEDGPRRYFIKVNDTSRLAMFEAEAAGLIALARPQALRVPTPVAIGVTGEFSFLVLEYLDLRDANSTSMESLGRGLAILHRTTQDCFGWCLNNTIGTTPQHNSETSDWIEFWRTHRLGFQLHLARRESLLMHRGESLLAALPAFFVDYHPQPALLHGDLWGGNIAMTRTGEPVIFDPAVYYGDRETDLAMTELFGGFNERFYAAYNEAWPLDSGYELRKQLYNLYHILNHFNLFGGGYAHQSACMIDHLLSEIG
ncbi:putative ketoamine kinase slr1563 [Gammaproteobacteria bacterium]